MAYKVGQKFITLYSCPPVNKVDQYKVGSEVDISDENTGQKLAVFRILDSNEITIEGEIIEVVSDF